MHKKPQNDPVNTENELPQTTATIFKPITLFPPGTSCDDDSRPAGRVVQTMDEAAWLLNRNWVNEEKFFRPLREREKAAREAADETAKALKAEQERLAAEQARKEAEEAPRRAAAEAARKEAEAKAAKREARIQFLIQSARVQKAPLERRRSQIRRDLELTTAAMHGLCDPAAPYVNESEMILQLAEQAQQVLWLAEELPVTKKAIAAIDEQLRKDMEAAEHD